MTGPEDYTPTTPPSGLIPPASTVVTVPAPRPLPRTGVDPTPLAHLGLAAAALGGLAVLVARRLRAR